jgi:hypothetical protein
LGEWGFMVSDNPSKAARKATGTSWIG